MTHMRASSELLEVDAEDDSSLGLAFFFLNDDRRLVFPLSTKEFKPFLTWSLSPAFPVSTGAFLEAFVISPKAALLVVFLATSSRAFLFPTVDVGILDFFPIKILFSLLATPRAVFLVTRDILC